MKTRSPDIRYAAIDHWVSGKGFGFIRNSRGSDIFVHVSQSRGGELSEGDWVRYQVRPSKKKRGGVEAFDVLPFKRAEQSELEEIILDVGLLVSSGRIALELVEQDRKMKLLEASFPMLRSAIERGEKENWVKLAEQFNRKQERGLLGALMTSMFREGIPVDDDLVLRCWENEWFTEEPPASALAKRLNLGFRRSEDPYAWGVYSMSQPDRFALYARMKPETFEQVLTLVTAHRVQCGPLAWIEELADLRTTLEDSKKKEHVEALLPSLISNHLDFGSRCLVFLRKGVGEQSVSEWASSWTDIKDLVRREDSDFLDEDFLRLVFEESLQTQEEFEKIIESWVIELRGHPDWMKAVREVAGTSPERLFVLWVNRLDESLSQPVLEFILGTPEKNKLWVLQREKEQLCDATLMGVLKSWVDRYSSPSTRLTYIYWKQLVALYSSITEEGKSSLDAQEAIEVKLDRIRSWAKDGDAAWVGIGLLSEVFVLLDAEEHVQVMRKVFRHCETGELQPISSDFDYLLKLGQSEAIPFAERMTWRQIQVFRDEARWLRFEDLLQAYIENPFGWEPSRSNPWPLLDKCTGRTQAKWSARYIEFYSEKWGEETRWVNLVGDENYLHIYCAYEDNEAIRAISGVRWFPEGGFWYAPLSQREKAIEVAKSLGLLIRDEGSWWDNNAHLLHMRTQGECEKESGICIRCEGRKSLKLSFMTRKEFWWCRNADCHMPTHQMELDWSNRTMRGFADLLTVSFKAENAGSFRLDAERDGYESLCGAVNRFIQIYPHLRCGFVPADLGQDGVLACSALNSRFVKGCNQMLTPHGQSRYAHYRTTKFSCDNAGCSNSEVEVYLHHCSGCGSVIDGRFSAKCPNGWVICRSCHSCCSDKVMQKRQENLRHVGATTVAERVEGYGHKEKGEYYCPCCGGLMETKQGGDHQNPMNRTCPNCNPQS